MKRIVLIDDDTSIHDIFDIVFGREYEIYASIDGDAILNSELNPPHLFVIDNQLSKSSGIELCRFIKNSPLYKIVPVIILSASQGIVDAGNSAGADIVIEKPFCLDHLRAQIAAHIQKSPTTELHSA